MVVFNESTNQIEGDFEEMNMELAQTMSSINKINADVAEILNQRIDNMVEAQKNMQNQIDAMDRLLAIAGFSTKEAK